jgi:CubicO group peptidase (beta-lactamase class C family)
MHRKLCLLLSVAMAAQQPLSTGFSTERVARLRAALKESVDRKEFAGIHVGVIRKGKLAISESAGHQDMEAGKPVSASTIMRMASMTKPIASAAVMMLYEEGKFHLEDPISKWIPGMDKVRVLESEDSDGTHTVALKREITVKQLLTHTSGLNNSKAYFAKGTFGRDQTLREMAAKLPGVPLSHQPGEAWRYGMSIDVLGYLVEVWSGKTFDVFLRERIFEPLGIGHRVPCSEGETGPALKDVLARQKRCVAAGASSWRPEPAAEVFQRRRRVVLHRHGLPAVLPDALERRNVGR